jgi:hypothetical protein
MITLSEAFLKDFRCPPGDDHFPLSLNVDSIEL